MTNTKHKVMLCTCLTIGLTGSILVMTSPFVRWWVLYEHSYTVPTLTAIAPEFAYLYLLFLFGVISIILVLVTPFLEAFSETLNHKIFANLILTFSLCSILFAVAGVGHLHFVAPEGVFGIGFGLATTGALLTLITYFVVRFCRKK